jgi:hypothetical protein
MAAPLRAERSSAVAPQMRLDGEAMGRRAALAALVAIPAAANAMTVSASESPSAQGDSQQPPFQRALA